VRPLYGKLSVLWGCSSAIQSHTLQPERRELDMIVAG